MAEPTLMALPAEEALAHFEAKGKKLHPSFAWQDVWQAEHGRQFTVAKSTGFDILRDVHDAVHATIRDGTTFDTFRKGLTPILQKKGWWGRKTVADPATGEFVSAQLGSPRRLRIIFDTNLRMAHSVGRWQQMQRVKERRPWLRYVSVRDNKTRPEHRAWHGTVLPVDHPWWDTHWPPNGWRCRCIVQQLSQRDLDRYGYQPSDGPPDDGPSKPYTNPRTGEVVTVPRGIDPGFAYNPGKTAPEAVSRDAYNMKLAAAPPALSVAAIREDLSSDAFQRFLTGREPGRFAVGILPADLMPAIGARAQTVLLSRETVVKQVKHPEAKAEEYLRLQRLFEEGEVIQDGDRHLVFILVDEQPWLAVVKATGIGDETYLQSYRRTDIADWQKKRRTGKVIRPGK